MGVVATMVVRVGATVDDLVKGMDKATKEVAKASDKITRLGEKMTLGITLPALIAGGAMAKMAAQAEATSRRVDRVFGDQAAAVKEFAESLKRTIPETAPAIEGMITRTAMMARGLGVSRDEAIKMSEQLVKLGGDISAGFGVPIEDALGALEQGLAGRGRGLKEFGIALGGAAVKAEAFRQGILGEGKELGSANTALASFSLIMKNSGLIQGEAARTADEVGRKVLFLRARVEELSEKLGQHLLPAIIKIIDAFNRMMDFVDRLPPGLVKFAIGMIAIAAAVGPILTLVGYMGKLAVAVKSISVLAGAATGIGEFFAALTAPEWIVGLGLVAAAIWAVKIAWDAVMGSKEKASKAAGTSIAGAGGKGKGILGIGAGGEGDDTNKLSPFEQFKQRAGFLAGAFDDALKHGRPVVELSESIARSYAEAVRLVKAQGGAWTKVGVEAQAVIDRFKPVVDLMNFNSAKDKGAFLRGISQRGSMNAGGAGVAAAISGAEQYGADLKMREILLRLPPVFDKTREAALRLGESLRSTGQEWDVQWEQLVQGLRALRAGTIDTANAMKAAATQMYQVAAMMVQGLANNIAGKIGHGSGAASIFSQLEGAAGAGVGAALGGPIGAAIGGALGTVIGAVQGKVLGKIGGAITGLFHHHKKKVDDSANALAKLANATNAVTAALTNVPTGFKIALARYEATQVGMPTSVSSAGNGLVVLNIDTLHVNGVQDPETFYDQLAAYARQNAGRGGTPSLSFAIGS